MRRGALSISLVVALFSLAGAGAFAQAPPYPAKDFADKDRPMNPAKQAEMERLRGAHEPLRPAHERMSPEDRRQLRRDIDQHGRELYRGRNR